jgi:hypothetical protein
MPDHQPPLPTCAQTDAGLPPYEPPHIATFTNDDLLQWLGPALAGSRSLDDCGAFCENSDDPFQE